VKLVVTTNNGCKDSITQSITINPKPVAGFTISNSAQCLSNNSFSFTSTSTVSSGSITNYSWSFGDGGTSTAQDPTYSYAAASTYQVKLVVTTNNGCKDSITQAITVYPQPTAVTYTINASNQCLTNNSFSFATNATVSAGTVGYSWSFGDGGTSNLQNPTYNYTVAGTYHVKLIVTTNNGCKDSAVQTLTVYPQPTVAFNTNNNPQCLNNNSFSFTNTSTVSSGSITSYSWSFGDGRTSNAQHPTYSYAAAGTYQVKLVVSTNNGCKDSITQSITINPQPTATNFAINAGSQCLSGNSFLFTTNATVAGGTVSYAWNFGDGGTSSLQNPSYNYATAGTYQVKLIITTNNGCKDSVAQSITVYAQPTAGYTVNTIQQCFSNNIFVFTNTSSISSGTIVQYAWNFGNGITSSVQNPVYSYTVPGTYQVKLVITSNNGCKDSIIQNIIVSPQPTGVNFTVNSSSQCFSGNSFSFNASASVNSGNITSYNWNFGDGTTATGPTSTHSYTAAGTYQVKLVVITDNGCKDSIIQNVTGFAQPIAGFSINNNQQCLNNNSLSFTNLSTVGTGTISTYQWDFGDGQTSSAQNPTHVYTAAGLYAIRLIVTTDNGCKDTITQSITIYPQPTATSFTINAGSQCLTGNSFAFTTNATVASGTITYSWNFGDGSTSTLQNPTHAYATAGTYPVRLVITTDNGCKDSVSNNITVYPQPTGVDFTVNGTSPCVSGNSFAFNTNATVASGTVSYGWDFGDGSTSTLQNPTHTYAVGGTYDIKLVVITNNGCKDSIVKNVTLHTQPTGVDFSVNANAQCLGSNSFSFATNATVSSGNITYSWSFGDGGISALQNPTHAYAAAGTYIVKLVIATDYGCNDSVTHNVTVYPQPVAGFSINDNQQCFTNNGFTFTNTSTVSSGSIANYYWTFGDGQTSNAQNPTHAFATAGNYQIKLVITTNQGCKDSITQSISVYLQPTGVDFAINSNGQCLTNNSFAFTTNATVSSGTVSYQWNFGDGQTSTVQNPVHAYTSAGTYQVKLVVTTNTGCADSISKSITVYAQPTGVDFTFNSSAQCFSNNGFSFSTNASVSTGSITYSWDFGDGSTSTVQNPNHVYATAGTYPVKLIITTNQGCKDSVVKNAMVYPQPTGVAYTINANNQCLNGNSVLFSTNAAVAGGTVSYGWNFGDGGTSTLQNPSHAYSAAGTYLVKLVITTNNGCNDSTTQTVIVYPQPVPGFNINNNAQCYSGNGFSFTNTSTVGSGSITNYSWAFGDGGTSTLQNPSHAYAAAGTYQVKLVVTTNNGCRDSASQTVTVYPQSVAGFSMNSNPQCLSNNNFAFTNTSTINSGSITNYDWNFGDGGTSTATSPSHNYAAAGTYQVKLVVTTNNGCRDSITQTITVYSQPTSVSYTINNGSQCLSNNSFAFVTNASVGGGTVTYSWNFGDGGTAALQNPSHNYLSAGTYQVKLLVTTNNGCRDSATQTVTVYAQPVAGFGTNNASQCLTSNSFVFTNASIISSGSITAYNWTFGDGGTSTLQDPTHAYAAAGSYQVKLVVTTNNGCRDSIIKTINVYPQPVASFTTINTAQCLSNNNFSFTSTSTISSGSISNYTWTFGDGGVSSLQNPSYSYLTAGTYQVTLVVTTNNGCKDSTTKTLTVYVQPTNINATVNSNAQCLNGNSFAFTGNATLGIGTINYSWNFGDGGTSALQNPTHVYALAGTYRVVFIATTNNGCKDSVIQTITVNPQPTSVSYTINSSNQCMSNNSFAFTTNASVGIGTVTYAWTFGDGGTSSSQNPTHNYAAAGTYPIKLVVTTNNGCKDSAIQNITAYPQPIAGFNTNNNPQCLGINNFTFTNTSTVPSGTITNYNWSFGNGGTSTAQNPTYVYTIAGTYQVKLVVTTNNGCKDSTTQNIVINAQPTDVTSTVNNATQCLRNNNFVFSATATVGGGSVSYAWGFGDGGTSTLQNPTHSYAVTGTYQVKLVVTTNLGCKDSTSQTVTVKPDAIAEITFNNQQGCAPYTILPTSVQVINHPTENISYEWYVNGVLVGTNISFPGYTIANDRDTATITLIAISRFGCFNDTATVKFWTVAKPHPAFTVSDTAGCGPLSINITNTTPSIGNFQYAWNFGQGQTSTNAQPGSIVFPENPNHTDITYTIALTGSSVCDAISITKDVLVRTKPKAAFTASNLTGCSPITVTFTNNSVGSNIQSFTWLFGDGTSLATMATTVSHVYTVTANTTFNVQLVANNICGSDTATIPILVKPNPININIQILNSQTSGCAPLTISLINASSGATSYQWNFGDGNTLTTTINGVVTHTYNTAGNYTVTIAATDGCAYDTLRIPVYALSLPSINFTVPTNPVCIGDPVLFNNLSETGLVYNWNFGDGYNSTLYSPTHAYTAAGTYTITLTVTRPAASGNGCLVTLTKQIVVVSQLPGAFSMSDAAGKCLPFAVSFSNQSLPSAQTTWDFGDGTTGTGNNISHTYTQNGNYVVSMVSISPGGCTYTASKNISVTAPVGNFAFSTGYQCANVPLLFQSQAQHVTSYVWDFGDGTVITTANAPVSHTYTTPGTYHPTLTIKNNDGCNVLIPVTDSIKIDKVVAAFTAQPLQTCLGSSTDFTNSSTAYFGMQQSQWNFGDGGSSSTQNPSHPYASTGTYPVQLITTGISGCKDTATQSLNIQVYQVPIASIVSNDDACVNSNITFNSSVIGNDPIASYSWTLSNGNTSSSANASATFTQAGVSTAMVIVKTIYGCSDTATKTINIRPLPTVNAGADASVCWNTSKQLNANGAATYQWEPSPTLSCTNCPNPVATPTANTSYNVTGISAYGCTARDTVNLRVVDTFVLTANDAVMCRGDKINLLATGAATYQWSPSNTLNAGNIANPVASPTGTTTYTVTGKDAFGCFTKTAAVTVTVNPLSTLYIGKDSVTTTESSYQFVTTVGVSPALTWSWAPATGLSCTNCPNPFIELVSKDVTYIATITNQWGCRTRDTLRIMAFCPEAKLFIPNILTPDGDGYNDMMVVRAQGIKKVTSVKVFNRWGELVFTKNDFIPNDKTFGWDGKYKGKLVDPDVFVYVCEVICENNRTAFFKGNITVIR
jgi:gliding motility-associated-like protein